MSFRVQCAVLGLLAATAVGSEARADFLGKFVTITNDSASGYTYEGRGFSPLDDGIPGTTNPDSRRRPKVYNDFPAFDTSTVGDTISLTYDILWTGAADNGNESQDWRFGFVSTGGNGGAGVSLGANFDMGDLAGTTAYEFFADTEMTTGEGTPASGEMDTAFTGTLNTPSGDTDRIGQSNNDPFADDVSFNDRTDTHRVVLTLERIVDGYDLSIAWTNLVSGNTINHMSTITTGFPGATDTAAGITSWDRVGFFINDDRLDNTNPIAPYEYEMSNISVSGNGVPLSLGSNWIANASQIPEPTSALLGLLGIVELGRRRPRR